VKLTPYTFALVSFTGTARVRESFTPTSRGSLTDVKVFHCDHCGALVFFENSRCVACGHALAFLPEPFVMGSLEQVNEQEWVSPIAATNGRKYRLCSNYVERDNCNWAVGSEDGQALCYSCRLTTVIPDLDVPGQLTALYKLESAKRRLVYSLLQLALPLQTKAEDPDRGLAFEFRAPTADAEPVLTGHDNGVITINVEEADDAEREKRRNQLHEPYRTLLGHLRHEVGHYYWDRLIANGDRLAAFRELFGDEQLDYAEALKLHYENGAPADWQERFVSAYSSSHPWEDWAETWAHYLHMTDTLDTAAACGLMLKPRREDEPSMKSAPADASDFQRLIDAWYPLTYVLNNLNRGLGQSDAYPFVLSAPAVAKLRFVHETILAHAAAQRQHSDLDEGGSEALSRPPSPGLRPTSP